MDASYPDSDGVYKRKERIYQEGEEILSTAFDLFLLEKRIASLQIPVEISFDPGRYLCNYLYYLALKRTKKALFIHLPPEDVLSIQKDMEAVKTIIDRLLEDEK